MYTVVENSEEYLIKALELVKKRVNELLKIGFKPIGGISITRYNISEGVRYVVAQAMYQECNRL